MNKIYLVLCLLVFASLGTKAQVPNEPTNLVVTPINTGGMVQFTAPSDTGSSTITNYEYSTDGGTTWVTPSPALTESPLIISSGLTNCTTYSIKLRAVNSAGSGTASASANLTPTASVVQAINWKAITSAADNQWPSVTYGNGLFVAVAATGTGNRVMTSPDGVTWTSRTSAADNNWYGVTYGNGVFVAVSISGTGNRVMTSPDGITWTSRTSAADNDWRCVTYGNSLFVAVSSTGTGNRVMTSPDGITWTARTSAVDNDWRYVTYGNGLFVAVSITGTGNRVMTSPDGITWTSRTSPAVDNIWNSVTYGNGLFVAVASTGTGNRVMTSPDGITWTSRTSAVDNEWRCVTYGNGLFVAVAWTGTGNRVMTSPDGITWTSRTSAVDNRWFGVTYGNGVFVAVSISVAVNRLMVSSLSPTADAPVISAITPRNNGASVAFTQTASAFSPVVSNYEYSTDNGSTWTARNPASHLSPMIISGLSNGNNYDIKIRAINAVGTSCISNMIAVTPAIGTIADAPTNLVVTPINTGGMIQFSAPANDGGSIITNYEYSTNGGANWITPSPAITESTLIISSDLTNCTSYSIKLRAVNESGSGTASASASLTPTASVVPGVNWTSRTSAADNSWYGITYGNGVFVAVSGSGSGNRVMTSPDGINWTIRIPAADNFWNSVTYGNGQFVAVSESGTGNRVMTSPDGITWTSRTSPADNSWMSVTYANGLFVAVAYSGTGNRVMTSPDGINWTTRTSASNNNWVGVTYGNGLFVAVASTGTNRVMTSPDGINWTTRTPAVDNAWNSVTFGNGLFVAVSSNGTGNRVMTSPNGSTWTSRTSPANNSWNSVKYGNGLFVAVASTGAGNRVMTSPDGINWTTRTPAAENSWRALTYGNGLFVAAAASGIGNRVMTSSFSVAADAPVIGSATFGSTTTVNFTQSSSMYVPSISNYEYSTDNGSNWAAVSPAATTSPLTITGLAAETNSIMIRAVNSVGNSCASNKLEAAACSPTSFTETINACSSYTWHGNIYTTSNNTATWTGTNAEGCDSVVTLNLTINQPSTSTSIVTATGSYTWNGTTYYNNGAYTYQSSNSNGCDSLATLNLTITINNIMNVCTYIGTNQTLIYTASVAGASSYAWTLPANTQLVSGQGTRSIVVKLLNGFASQSNKQIRVTPAGGSLQIIYLAAQSPLTPRNISASTNNICGSIGTNVPILFTIPRVYETSSNGSTASSYLWTAQNGTTNISHPNGTGENDTTVAVTFNANFSTSTITVQSVNACGVSGIRSYLIIRNNPTVGIISGPTNSCEYIGTTGVNATYSVTAVTNIDSYTWTIPTGATNVSGQGTNTTTFKYPAGYTGGSISVTGTNGCGTSSARILTISRLLPGTPGNIDVINTATCPNREYTYAVASIPSNATSMLWTVPSSGTIVSGQGTRSITVSYAGTVIDGYVTTKAVSNCGTSSVRSAIVKLAPCPAAPGTTFTKGVMSTMPTSLDVNVFPNPTTSSFNLQVTAGGSKSAIEARVLDLQGRLMKTLIIHPNENISLGAELKPGVYMLEVLQSNEKKVVRMVKY